jgi:hypothetical protein
VIAGARTKTYHHGELQFCWAHFKRNVLGARDLAKTTEAERFCHDALVLQARLFRLWYRFRGDPAARGAPLTRAQLIDKVLPSRAVELLLEAGQPLGSQEEPPPALTVVKRFGYAGVGSR